MCVCVCVRVCVRVCVCKTAKMIAEEKSIGPMLDACRVYSVYTCVVEGS